MATLDSAAPQALADAIALRAQIEAMHDGLVATERRVGDATQALQAQWSDLSDRLDAVIARAGEELAHVHDGGAPSHAALAQLHRAAEAAPAEIADLLAHGQQRLEAFGAWCSERCSELRARADEVDSAAARLRDQAARLRQTIDGVASDAAASIGELVHAVALHGADDGGGEALTISERQRRIAYELREESVAALEQRWEQLLSALRTARESLESELAQAAGETEHEIDEAAAAWEDGHRELVALLHESTHEAVAAVTQAEELTAGMGESTQADLAALAESHEALAGQLGDAGQKVHGVLDLLRQFDFVQL